MVLETIVCGVAQSERNTGNLGSLLLMTHFWGVKNSGAFTSLRCVFVVFLFRFPRSAYKLQSCIVVMCNVDSLPLFPAPFFSDSGSRSH